MDDPTAFDLYPLDRIWYDKLDLSLRLGYTCGIDRIPYSGRWIIRPISNLDGMGIGAVLDDFAEGDYVPPGYFYSEVFTGPHVTIDYKCSGDRWPFSLYPRWVQGATFRGYNTPEDLIRFTRWTRIDYPFDLPVMFNTITAPEINVELINGKIIEVHLRTNPDPIDYDDIIPVWNSNQECPPGYRFVADLSEYKLGRLGFFCI